MLSSCFGLPLRTGTNIIAIINLIASICYICYYIWEHIVSYDVPEMRKSGEDIEIDQLLQITEKVFLNYITLVFMLVGFTSLFASFGLKQATSYNATHKIYLWLLIGYVQLGTVLTIEIVILMKHPYFIKHNIIGLIIFFALLDVAIGYQLLVVQSFYKEEKLVEETNYSRLRSDLTTQIEHQDEEEFQNIDL
ncbi:uncharacterized protein LOC112595963 [Melanaphis sacchari]|uniref:uncharacterized protein LOC112595963 n=1 Tax=Melanaphis sacchari TaxID=742174 RepID=UPI000DC141E2|nr:uncharacterized protein LOC112595963 [Melanaphis sacchari]